MLKVMAELVIQNSNGNDVTTSLIVAQVFEKEHKNVVRDIENLSCSESFNRLNFERITYRDSRNREQTAYEMTKDGFSFLVMGYTGAKAGEFKEKFISEFNKREMMLKDDDYILMRSQQILQKRVEAAEQRVKALEADNQQKDAKIAKLQPKADFADAAFITDDKVDIGMAAKILKLGFGRNTLFQKLRQVGVFFSNRNEPKQRFVNAGYFEMKEKFIERNSHPGFVVTKILVTQKGLAYINHLFGGNPSDGKIAAIE
jgi:Rha family phage regulatory protein